MNKRRQAIIKKYARLMAKKALVRARLSQHKSVKMEEDDIFDTVCDFLDEYFGELENYGMSIGGDYSDQTSESGANYVIHYSLSYTWELPDGNTTEDEVAMIEEQEKLLSTTLYRGDNGRAENLEVDLNDRLQSETPELECTLARFQRTPGDEDRISVLVYIKDSSLQE